MVNLVGRRLGKYQIRAEIGRGGMGTVYRAYDQVLHREVAIKVLSPYLSGDRECVQRFALEAKSAASLHHPNIVPIFDIGTEAGLHYLVMQVLPGRPLSQILHKEGGLPPQRVAHIAAQVASALDYAHGHGLVHRDVKPANIVVGPDGHATLTDFGIVHAAATTKLTQQDASLGTPAYMSPEQVRGGQVGPPADIYALGILCYEMLAGNPPFQGDTLRVLHAHAYDTPPPLRGHVPQLSGELEAVVQRALAKDPRRRWPSAGALAQGLGQAVARLPQAVRTAAAIGVAGAAATPPRGLGRQRVKTDPRVIGIAIVAAVAVLALVLILSLRRGTADQSTATPTALTTQHLAGATVTAMQPANPTLSATAQHPSTQVPPTPSATPLPSATPTAKPPPSRTATPSRTPTASSTPTPSPAPTPTDTPKPACRPAAKGRIGFKRQKRCNAANGDGCGKVTIWVMNDDGSRQGPMCNPGIYERALLRDRTANDNSFRLEVVRAQREDIARVFSDGRTELIISNNRKDWDPVLSADNWWLAWVTNRNANDEIYIKTIDWRDPNQRRLTVNEWEWDKHPTWSPDGRKIAFYSNRAKKLNEATRQIWVMDIVNDQGTNLRNLSQNPGQVDTDPVWFKWDEMP